jgi:hypothetical protein
MLASSHYVLSRAVNGSLKHELKQAINAYLE